MNYLLTGATGFIGQHLVHYLLSNGNEVNYIGRQRSNTLDGRAAFHLWSRGDEPSLNSVPKLDAVIHLAGEPVAQRWNERVKQAIYSSRVDGTRKLVTAIEKVRHKPSVLVSASAVGIYGDRGDEILTEESAPGQDFLAHVCVGWEREALRAREWGIRVVLLRIAIVLGRNGGALKQMLVPFRLGLGGPLGSGKQWMPWIQLDDLVRLFAFAAEHEEVHGALNASAPQPVINAQFTKALAQAVHRPAVTPVPKFALRMALGQVADFTLASQRVIPEATQKAGFQFVYSQIEEALRSVI
ncbi:MAG: TIGR01777 family oxidoreductase [Acidobacteriaceae bacterium]|nr:TIGR01777 family oxidoreductase [Acidobacteriaceae bacterium]MBV9033954.1 TIGR01777 family oxidoreductase [Acidobacteriaceae bacterium]MBV9679533.1 TIGR01777 family oxidoreductase [Acidobacteriaceae bacterium]